MKAAVVIPFRDRGRDPLRPANLKRVLQHWEGFNAPVFVVDDGRSGEASFNRSAAYNRGAAMTDADVIVYSEADLIVDFRQIVAGIKLAAEKPGLVVPFSRFMAMAESDSIEVRKGNLPPHLADAQQIRGERRSIGAVNIVSREALHLIGQYDECFEGAWHDDDAMELAFRITCGPTRFVDGPGYHLYHLPGAQGGHLSDADRAATAANKRRWELYLEAKTPERIRELTAGAPE
ncbi:glycosyltransferase [Mycobacterium phage Schatzie]|nr:glycosyltransferase [Mycobacterium phage Hughesyang]QCO93708.1 glycosyltransferase [Mycobacterium phage Schatzie]WNM72578.1 glycosyltransferase [Mycobacterium phage Bombitas]